MGTIILIFFKGSNHQPDHPMCPLRSAYDQHLVALRSRGIEPLNGAMARCDWSLSSPLHGALHAALHFAARRINAFTRYTTLGERMDPGRYGIYGYPEVRRERLGAIGVLWSSYSPDIAM